MSSRIDAHAAGDAAMLRLADRSEWQQVMLVGADRHRLAPAGFAQLTADLEEAEAAGVITGYHFLRKDGGLRLRVAPDQERARRTMDRILDSLTTHGKISEWVRGVYEPEVYAFGGPAAMDIAHRLFCADSRAALAAAGRADHRGPGPRETATLLVSALLRAADLDWYEQGDVWAKVSDHRPAPALPSSEHLAKAYSAMRRLMTVEGAAAPVQASEPGWMLRLAAFETAGHELAQLARSGQIQRGLRAILAHHLIFAFNRAGLAASEQSALSYLAKEVVMQHPIGSNPGPTGGTASLGQTGTTPTIAPATIDEEAARLRAELTAQLRERGSVRTPRIAEAFAAVPRHLFVPDAPLPAAYADEQVFTKHTGTGVAISAASQPRIVAMMLEQLDAHPGHSVLEAGAGTGYNAALLGYLVGPNGHVTTLDVDCDLVDGAREHLTAARADNVTALLADGALGDPDTAPFHRVIATVGAGDVPPAWLDQLAPGGRLVVPLRIRGGVSRSIAFERDGAYWRAVSSEMCTFMPLRGIADDPRLVIPLTPDGQVSLHTYRDQRTDPAALATVLAHPGTEIYTGVLFRKGDPWEWVNLWLACALPGGLVRMPQSGPAVESGQLRPQFPWGAMATVDEDSLAYLTLRPGEDETGEYWEAGAIGHGPRGDELAARVAEELRSWGWGCGYRSAHPVIRLTQNHNRETLTGQFTIDKPCTRLAISWE
ncbi:MAG: methyltransferase, FxLD system [Pseudonocardiales bacterium]